MFKIQMFKTIFVIYYCFDIRDSYFEYVFVFRISCFVFRIWFFKLGMHPMHKSSTSIPD